mmetsp:Transcript_13982/g.27738  ORF Transcript_13982/g.27738 Transcript_13982/m.27738 type:complete len:255 (+) Transcript_13982:1223-1987(+)
MDRTVAPIKESEPQLGKQGRFRHNGKRETQQASQVIGSSRLGGPCHRDHEAELVEQNFQLLGKVFVGTPQDIEQLAVQLSLGVQLLQLLPLPLLLRLLLLRDLVLVLVGDEARSGLNEEVDGLEHHQRRQRLLRVVHEQAEVRQEAKKTKRVCCVGDAMTAREVDEVLLAERTERVALEGVVDREPLKWDALLRVVQGENKVTDRTPQLPHNSVLGALRSLGVVDGMEAEPASVALPFELGDRVPGLRLFELAG